MKVHGGSLFDAYIAVDWSARSSPSRLLPTRDAIWVGERFTDASRGEILLDPHYFRTRQQAGNYIQQRLRVHVAERRRAFVGFDFSFAFPAGFAASLGYTGSEPWRWIWSLLSDSIQDDDANRNNRFQIASDLNARCGSNTPGPFWGCPPANATVTLSPTMVRQFRYPYSAGTELNLERTRLTEHVLPGVQSTWKLYGAGSVGGQALLGIPVVKRLRDDPAFAGVSRVWPFETGFSTTPTPSIGPSILHAEIWPGVVRDRLDRVFPIRDQAQVHAYVTWLADLDRRGELGELFANAGDGTVEGNRRCIREEGWILGAKPR